MRIAWILSLAVSLACAAPARAAWPFSWLGCGRSSAAVQTTNVAHKSSAGSALDEMAGGTKRLVSNTKNLFKPKQPPAKRTGLLSTRSPSKKPEAPKQGFFQQLFNPEPPPPPKTVAEWMALDQVHP